MGRLIFDYLGPFKPSKKKIFVLVAIYSKIKYIFNKVIKSAKSTVQFMIQIVSQWEFLRNLLSVRDIHFKTYWQKSPKIYT
jgi:hypothetical protein